MRQVDPQARQQCTASRCWGRCSPGTPVEGPEHELPRAAAWTGRRLHPALLEPWRPTGARKSHRRRQFGVFAGRYRVQWQPGGAVPAFPPASQGDSHDALHRARPRGGCGAFPADRFLRASRPSALGGVVSSGLQRRGQQDRARSGRGRLALALVGSLAAGADAGAQRSRLARPRSGAAASTRLGAPAGGCGRAGGPGGPTPRPAPRRHGRRFLLPLCGV